MHVILSLHRSCHASRHYYSYSYIIYSLRHGQMVRKRSRLLDPAGYICNFLRYIVACIYTTIILDLQKPPVSSVGDYHHCWILAVAKGAPSLYCVQEMAHIGIIETMMYFNIVSFAALTLYYHNTASIQETIAHISVSLTFILFLVIIFYHVYKYTAWSSLSHREETCP